MLMQFLHCVAACRTHERRDVQQQISGPHQSHHSTGWPLCHIANSTHCPRRVEAGRACAPCRSARSCCSAGGSAPNWRHRRPRAVPAPRRGCAGQPHAPAFLARLVCQLQRYLRTARLASVCNLRVGLAADSVLRNQDVLSQSTFAIAYSKIMPIKTTDATGIRYLPVIMCMVQDLPEPAAGGRPAS